MATSTLNSQILEASGRLTPFLQQPPDVPPETLARFERKYRRNAEALVSALVVGTLTLADWQQRMNALLAGVHLATYAQGVGGVGNLDANDIGDVNTITAEQQAYLAGWATSLASVETLTTDERAAWSNGTAVSADLPSPAMMIARAMLYYAAAHRTLEIARAASIGLPRMPVYPGEGSPCMTNCRCRWDYARVEGGWDCTWMLGKAEHCGVCVARAEIYRPLRYRNGYFI